MRFASSNNGETLGDPIVLNTPQEYPTAITQIKDVAKSLMQSKSVNGVYGGIAGVLNEKKSGLLRAPHLPNWEGAELQKDFSEIFGTQVGLENDCAVAGLGEAVGGAGKNYSIVAYLALGTGVGGTRIQNNKIDQGRANFEVGHQIINITGPKCPGCGGLGHLESYVSGSALQKQHGRKLNENGDEQAWDEIAEFLSIGIHNLNMHWSPDVVVIGGAIGSHEGLKIETVKKYLKQLPSPFSKLPEVKKSTLGELAGLYGALELLRNMNN